MSSPRCGKAATDPADHLAHAVLDEARPAVRLLDHGALVGALHQLVDLRRHRGLDDPDQRQRVDVGVAGLGAADAQRAEPALVVGGDRDRGEHALDLVVGEALLEQPLARGLLHQRLRARAGGHPGRGDADQAARAGAARHRGAVQRVDLLRRDARDRRRLVLRVARGDRDLGGLRVLALADLLGDVLGERLGAEAGLAEDHLADRVVDDLLEARHVRALLARAEVDEALELRVEQLLDPVLADADDLLDAGDADARERQREVRNLGLDVLDGRGSTRIFVHKGKGSGPFVHTSAQKASLPPQGFPKADAGFRATKAVDGTGQPPAEHR